MKQQQSKQRNRLTIRLLAVAGLVATTVVVTITGDVVHVIIRAVMQWLGF